MDFWQSFSPVLLQAVNEEIQALLVMLEPPLISDSNFHATFLSSLFSLLSSLISGLTVMLVRTNTLHCTNQLHDLSHFTASFSLYSLHLIFTQDRDERMMMRMIWGKQEDERQTSSGHRKRQRPVCFD